MNPAHVVMFSGGIGSWATAKRVVQRHGAENTILLFTDTKIEDEDLYRFLDEAAANVGAPLVKIADGRTPWQLFRENRFIGNPRVDICSRVLKRDLARKWIESNFRPDEAMIYLGIDWTEEHRFRRARERWKPYKVEAPLCDPPYLTKKQLIVWLQEEGIKPPRLYELGFPHNNCGGFCVKQGQAAFKRLLEVFPERYAEHEREEEACRQLIGKDVAILRDRRGGKTRPLTLKEFRERVEAGLGCDEADFGGCGCFVG